MLNLPFSKSLFLKIESVDILAHIPTIPPVIFSLPKLLLYTVFMRSYIRSKSTWTFFNPRRVVRSACTIGQPIKRTSGSEHTWELQVLAKHVNDDMPPFLMIDIVGECGDGIVRQRYERRLSRFLGLWFLSFRAWTGHTGKHGKTKGGGCRSKVPPLSSSEVNDRDQLRQTRAHITLEDNIRFIRYYYTRRRIDGKDEATDRRSRQVVVVDKRQPKIVSPWTRRQGN